MRRRPRRLLPLLLLLAVPACATPPPLDRADRPQATPHHLALNEKLATRRGGSARPVALWAGAGPRCGGSALDDPAVAQRLMAATRADGPRDLEVPVMHCAPVFRAL